MKTDFLPLPAYRDYRHPDTAKKHDEAVDRAIARLEELHRARKWYRDGQRHNVVNLSDVLDAS